MWDNYCFIKTGWGQQADGVLWSFCSPDRWHTFTRPRSREGSGVNVNLACSRPPPPRDFHHIFFVIFSPLPLFIAQILKRHFFFLSSHSNLNVTEVLRACLRVPWKRSLMAVNRINGAYPHNKMNYWLSNGQIEGGMYKTVKHKRLCGKCLACKDTWTDKVTYLFFMRSTTPKKIMTKSRMPAMTPAILTVWSVCFSGSTASGLWVADPGRF